MVDRQERLGSAWPSYATEVTLVRGKKNQNSRRKAQLTIAHREPSEKPDTTVALEGGGVWNQGGFHRTPLPTMPMTMTMQSMQCQCQCT